MLSNSYLLVVTFQYVLLFTKRKKVDTKYLIFFHIAISQSNNIQVNQFYYGSKST